MPEQPEISEQPRQQFVFAYGSLVRDLAVTLSRGARACRLRDRRRAWNLAMDNAVSLPGYKYYLDARDSSRPTVFVAFLNLIAAPGDQVNGVLYPVHAEELPALDRREQNYRRVDVSDSIDQRVDGPVWTYVGTAAAERRFVEGVRANSVVVDKAYLDTVRAGFASLAGDALDEFDACTEPHGCRVIELLRIALD